jgi:dTDP-4-dehydrorhamnose reductase
MAHTGERQHEVVRFDRSTLDITDDAAVRAAVERAKPDAIVNCAGFNAVDAAETQAVAALQANAFAVRSLARAAHDTSAIRPVQQRLRLRRPGDAWAPIAASPPPKLLGSGSRPTRPCRSPPGVAPGGPTSLTRS